MKLKKTRIMLIFLIFLTLLTVLLYVRNIREGEFSAGRIEVGLAFTAKNFCSCLYVTKNTEKNCRDYAALDVVSPRLTIDKSAKKTKSSFLFFISSEAQFVSPEVGCALL